MRNVVLKHLLFSVNTQIKDIKAPNKLQIWWWDTNTNSLHYTQVVGVKLVNWDSSAVPVESVLDEEHKSCIKKQAQYYFKEDFSEIEDTFYPSKNNCTR